jgi:serine/threonine-protein kinase
MPRATLTIGQNLDGKVRVARYTGEGGIGSLYDGLMNSKPVTVQAAPGEFIKDPGAFLLFQREAQAAAALGNTHIAEVRATGRAPDGTIFIVTERLKGETLLQRGHVGPGRAAHIACQIADALAAAHGRGLLHRDLDPDLVFLVQNGTDPDFVKLLGFGWNRVLGDDPALRAHAQALGYLLPWWNAPELTRRLPGDPRSDLYSTGALLYTAATGRPPYGGTDINSLYQAIAGGRYAPARSIDPGVPPPLEQAIMIALAQDPAHRYPSAQHMIQTLAPFAQPAQVPALPEPKPARGGPDMEGVAAQMDEIEAKPQSKAIPIAVAGGIAVAVFTVLFAVRSGGTAKPTVGTTTDQPAAKPEATPDKPAPPPDKPAATPDKPAPPPDKPVAAAAPDAAPQVAATAAPDAAPKPAADTPKMTTLTFDVKPPDAVVAVNGKAVTGGTAQYQAGNYKVKVEVHAPGYLPHDEEVAVDKDATVAIELKKEVAATKPPPEKPTATPHKPPPTHEPPPRKPPKKPKIDL